MAARISINELEEAFADKLVTLRNEPTEYALCIV
jgi:hypothetical protein